MPSSPPHSPKGRKRKGTYSPYALFVKEKGDIQPAYFTISATGVDHIDPENPCETTSLADWTDQSMMYSALTSMNFFKYYTHRKLFEKWRANARYLVYCERRKKLAKELFLAKPMFVGAIMQCNAILKEVTNIRTMNIHPSKVYSLQDFADMSLFTCIC